MSEKQPLSIQKIKGRFQFGIINLNFNELKIIKDSLILYSSVNKHQVAQKLSSEINSQLSKITI